MLAARHGTTGCMGSDGFGGAFPERMDFTIALRFLPGVRAGGDAWPRLLGTSTAESASGA